MAQFDKIVVVTKQTELERLQQRFGTAPAARFYIVQAAAAAAMARPAPAPSAAPAGGTRSAHASSPALQQASPEPPPDEAFQQYQASHDEYMRALETLRRALPEGVRTQFIERAFLPNFSFGDHDLVVTLGPDGLVVNTGKYLSGQPILAVNPDPARIDGILVPFRVEQAAQALRAAMEGGIVASDITMAQATLNDGQILYGVNDLFIGQQTHVSARYQLRFREAVEDQSSSGIIVSTGAGSTGWFRSIITGAVEVVDGFFSVDESKRLTKSHRFDWQADYLYFSVREPFVSRTSSANMTFGRIEGGEQLEVVSQMPQHGVIFSDGIETDYLAFNSGAIATIGVADRKVRLITRAG